MAVSRSGRSNWAKKNQWNQAVANRAVGAGEGIPDRDAVQDDERGHHLGDVQGETGGDVAAPIVADHRELPVPKVTHQPGAVTGHARLECGT